MSTVDTPREQFMGTLRSDGPPTNLPAAVSDCRSALAVHQAEPSHSSMAALHAAASQVIDAAYSVPAVVSAPAPAGWHKVDFGYQTPAASHTDTASGGHTACAQPDCPGSCPFNVTDRDLADYAYYRDNGYNV